VPIRGWSRLARYRNYTDELGRQLPQLGLDCVIGFNKMPHLDIYFAADSCFIEKAETQRGAYYKYTPRFRHFSHYEEAVFGDHSRTLSLLLSELQRQAYLKHYPNCAGRLQLLPPGISADRRVEQRDPKIRSEFRREFSIGDDELVVLQVGSGFRIKGVDRSLRAVAALSGELRRRVRYILVGQDRARRFLWQAKRLGIDERVMILPGRDDVPRFFAGADILLHPAYQESAGYVLLEAAIAGLPVLTTASCGYASYIQQEQLGQVCAEPFSQNELNTALEEMLKQIPQAPWSDNGLAFGKQDRLYRMPQQAADLIEQWVVQNSPGGPES
jgi:UDP-glucose:(heptosyl)LPS alpha-1,3-glucosyltransferase